MNKFIISDLLGIGNWGLGIVELDWELGIGETLEIRAKIGD